jgi:hypothetical protein
MGRWGHRKLHSLAFTTQSADSLFGMFEGDTDCDLESEVQSAIQKKLAANGVTLNEDEFMDLMNSFDSSRAQPEKPAIDATTLRAHLDHGICDEVLQDIIVKKSGSFEFYGPYSAVVAGAVMMKVGAKISTEHRRYLRQAAVQSESHAGYRLPIGDLAFRDPGQKQFLTAIENYVDGQPRSFHAPR